jgi:hypothetical protein
VRTTLLLARQPDQLERLGNGLGDHVPRLADHLQRERDVLVDGLVGQQTEVLEHRADLSPQVWHLPRRQLRQVASGDVHGAVRGLLLPQHELQERRLTRPRGTDQEDELASLDLERDVAQRWARRFVVDLGDVLELDHGVRVYVRSWKGRATDGNACRTRR